ncbi:MarR family transcriptional regulator [Sphingobium herbicidovorans NBRC 16415]|uniref:MarR family transcriptional regulator n=1 Tax=Sphingobium herbicidovorans (strain ATCC 700291 / DSM 11019 / CCUG 56400 / KCTC 2939 / LMG 18315 / NBRC 16415 / MH) TaxID=1219045 RepID=A0A086PA76_SPHHM|nr:MarR family transcriptional regulator [Sphingobium herbicidovorans]KFG90294.1 MarR family transcriptional regulator [Sphingobium herbicidovorans NBRC 16415]
MSRLEMERALARKLPLLARSWRALADEALAEFRVSNSAGWCLVHLDRLGAEARQADLAQLLGITQPSLVRTLDQLEAMALVERVPNPDDKRSNTIRFTAAGKELAGLIEERLDGLRRELLDGVPDAAIEITANLLELFGRRIAERRQRC